MREYFKDFMCGVCLPIIATFLALSLFVYACIYIAHASDKKPVNEKQEFMQQCTTKYDRADCEIFWHGGRIDKE